MHIWRDAQSAQEIVTLCAFPSGVQASAQEIGGVQLGNSGKLSCCVILITVADGTKQLRHASLLDFYHIYV